MAFQVPSHVELTPTETKVVSFVAQGLSNREIAEKLNVSQRTIESHVSNMLNKTSLNNRTELAAVGHGQSIGVKGLTISGALLLYLHTV